MCTAVDKKGREKALHAHSKERDFYKAGQRAEGKELIHEGRVLSYACEKRRSRSS